MSKFRIEPHGRLQEWVAEEKGYFRDEGLDYEFVNSYVTGESGYAAVQSTETAAPEVKRGAFENMERGRVADVSCACHWAVNMASSSGHGRMWGHAYSVTPSANRVTSPTLKSVWVITRGATFPQFKHWDVSSSPIRSTCATSASRVIGSRRCSTGK